MKRRIEAHDNFGAIIAITVMTVAVLILLWR